MENHPTNIAMFFFCSSQSDVNFIIQWNVKTFPLTRCMNEANVLTIDFSGSILIEFYVFYWKEVCNANFLEFAGGDMNIYQICALVIIDEGVSSFFL